MKIPAFRQNIKQMTPYKPPIENRVDSGCLLLDFNERTVPPGNKIKDALKNLIEKDHLHIYPEYKDINSKIAKFAGVKEDQVMITNGSDQGIDIICRAVLEKNDEVIIPSPSFAMFYQSAEVEGAKLVEPSYDENLNFPTLEVHNAINEKTRLVIICNPNNPTGTKVSREDVIKILNKAENCMVMVDEAYYSYNGETVADLINEYPNLCITRTFSKAFGFPSLRVGYILSDGKNIDEFLKIRGPYDINSFAVAAVEAALEDTSYVDEYVKEVMNDSKPILEKFFKENNIKFWPSNANFILFKPNDSEEMFKKLDENGIRVRPRKGSNIDGTIRVTIGTTAQTQKFIETYKSLI